MVAPKSTGTVADYLEEVKRGLTLDEISSKFGVCRNAVYMALRRANLPTSAKAYAELHGETLITKRSALSLGRKRTNFGRLSWKGYADILALLKAHAMSGKALSMKTGLSIYTARRLLVRLHELKVVYISSWVKEGYKHGAPAAQYRFGNLPDAPGEKVGSPRGPLTRYNAMPELVHAVSTLKAMAEPVTVTDLACEMGSQYGNILAFIKHCHAIGLVHIAEWKTRDYGGSPSPMYQVGDAPDRPRPKAQSRSEIEKRYREKRNQRDAMQRMIQATAANRAVFVEVDAA